MLIIIWDVETQFARWYLIKPELKFIFDFLRCRRFPTQGPLQRADEGPSSVTVHYQPQLPVSQSNKQFVKTSERQTTGVQHSHALQRAALQLHDATYERPASVSCFFFYCRRHSEGDFVVFCRFQESNCPFNPSDWLFLLFTKRKICWFVIGLWVFPL